MPAEWLAFVFSLAVAAPYERWMTRDPEVRSFALDHGRVCQLREESGVLQYRVLEVRESEWYTAKWSMLFAMHGTRFAPEPVTCYWEREKLSIVATGLNDQTWLFTSGEFIQIFTSYELLAYDRQREWLYMYEDSRVYRMDPAEFEAAARANEQIRDRVIPVKPLLYTNSTDWSDMMVIDGRIFYVYQNYTHEWLNNTEVLIGHANGDHFGYVLLDKDSEIDRLHWEDDETMHVLFNAGNPDQEHVRTFVGPNERTV